MGSERSSDVHEKSKPGAGAEASVNRHHSYGLSVDMPLDEGIAEAVHALRAEGVETIESCQGGAGHVFEEPTIRFLGGPGEGFRAYGVIVRAGFKPRAVYRVWTVDEGEITGPYWDLKLDFS